MIEYRYDKDIFNSKTDALVNTVNCNGIMGKGIALKAKKKYPEMFIDYREKARNKEIKVGKLYLYKTKDRLIINFPTKNYWRHKSKINYIEEGLKYFVDHYKDWNIGSVAIPQLGCGSGGLDWDIVKPLMENFLKKLDLKIEIYVDIRGGLIKKIIRNLNKLSNNQLEYIYTESSNIMGEEDKQTNLKQFDKKINVK